MTDTIYNSVELSSMMGNQRSVDDEIKSLTEIELEAVSGGFFMLGIAAAIYGPPLLGLGIAYAQGAFD